MSVYAFSECLANAPGTRYKCKMSAIVIFLIMTILQHKILGRMNKGKIVREKYNSIRK